MLLTDEITFYRSNFFEELIINIPHYNARPASSINAQTDRVACYFIPTEISFSVVTCHNSFVALSVFAF